MDVPDGEEFVPSRAYDAIEAELQRELRKVQKLVENLREFNEREYRRQWAIRGVGMGMPEDATHHARCYHHWFVTKAVRELEAIDNEGE